MWYSITLPNYTRLLKTQQEQEMQLTMYRYTFLPILADDTYKDKQAKNPVVRAQLSPNMSFTSTVSERAHADR